MTQKTGTQRRNQNKALHKFGCFISILELGTIIAVIVVLIRTALIPNKYLAIAAGCLILLLIIFRFLMNNANARKKFRTGLVLALIVSILTCAVIPYVNKLYKTLNSITDATVQTDMIGVYVLANDSAETIADAATYKFGISSTSGSYVQSTIDLINDDLKSSISTVTYKGLLLLADSLLSSETQAIILNEAYMGIFEDTDGYESFAGKVKEIASYPYRYELVDADVESVNGDSFIMYISGIDTRDGELVASSRSDVNILAVVNQVTHEILLVSIPRDAYVTLPVSNGEYDKLTHAGLYGIDCSMETMESIYDVNIDYYFRIDFTGFKDVVDALGGITVYSDYEFTAYTDEECSFTVGDNEMDGQHALAYARERYAYPDGDYQRGRNQMDIIEAIIGKMQTPAILRDFNGLMNTLADSFATSMPYATLAALAKEQLSSGASWEITQYGVDGEGTTAYTYSGGDIELYVMITDEKSLAIAKELIQTVIDGGVPVIPETEAADEEYYEDDYNYEDYGDDSGYSEDEDYYDYDPGYEPDYNPDYDNGGPPEDY